MSRSAGAGSPWWFRCHDCRPYKRSRYSCKGARSTATSREYTCGCGFTGWSNHVDLALIAHPEWTYREARDS